MIAQVQKDRPILERIAWTAMTERGLLPDFSAEALSQLSKINTPASMQGNIIDLRSLPWASVDNDDSQDLDQLTVAEALPNGKVRIRVAIADVDSLVMAGSPIDKYARQNTTSVYTAAKIFPMLPEKLSTNFTSLNPNEDRLAVVVDMTLNMDGSLEHSDVYRACVRNHAKLTYNGVSAWLEGTATLPQEIAGINGLSDNLQLQDQIAQSMKQFRQDHGALSLQTIKGRPKFEGDRVSVLEIESENRATDIIQNFMIAANGVTARFLASKGFPAICRVVRTPERWMRIVELASEHGFRLPTVPDSKALEKFLLQQKRADPVRFPDLSLAIVKLMGRGEYVAEVPGNSSPGHFGLAVKDYAHSTAPNRRYSDLITQRLLKAAIAGESSPYSSQELVALANQCTQQEDAANKVERQVGKSAAALMLQSRVGEEFDSIITGASTKGTWVRLLGIPVDGMLVNASESDDVGVKLRVKLISVNVRRGFIDFTKVGRLPD